MATKTKTPRELEEDALAVLKIRGYTSAGFGSAMASHRGEGAAGWPAEMRVAKDELLDAGYDQFTAGNAVNSLYLHSLPKQPASGPCDNCGASNSPWRDGAGRYLCRRHEDSY